MSRVLLVTNDFPPRRGGIQSYLGEFVGRLVKAGKHTVTVYAPKWKGAEAFDEAAADTGFRVVRHPTTLMLPVPAVDSRMRRLIADHDIDTVWFGAAAPLALLATRARQAGAEPVAVHPRRQVLHGGSRPERRCEARSGVAADEGHDVGVVTDAPQHRTRHRKHRPAHLVAVGGGPPPARPRRPGGGGFDEAAAGAARAGGG
ncbi:glycosyltransferase, partial [Mycobacterium asiaticum]|uniref:glycosyltransferase n=1 Tax=Mycobacterium asiaticum TaxID=1790 RepID=UPI003F519070